MMCKVILHVSLPSDHPRIAHCTFLEQNRKFFVLTEAASLKPSLPYRATGSRARSRASKSASRPLTRRERKRAPYFVRRPVVRALIDGRKTQTRRQGTLHRTNSSTPGSLQGLFNASNSLGTARIRPLRWHAVFAGRDVTSASFATR